MHAVGRLFIRLACVGTAQSKGWRHRPRQRSNSLRTAEKREDSRSRDFQGAATHAEGLYKGTEREDARSPLHIAVEPGEGDVSRILSQVVQRNRQGSRFGGCEATSACNATRFRLHHERCWYESSNNRASFRTSIGTHGADVLRIG